jgi:anaerobic selenocysteine-containing dehydrogenase
MSSHVNIKKNKQNTNNTTTIMDKTIEIDGRKMAMNRRSFMKSTAFFGGVLAASQLTGINFLSADKALAGGTFKNAYPFDNPENIIFSCCLQCHTACTIKTKIHNGVMVKVEGNPYSPMNMHPHLPYDMSVTDAIHYDGRLCPKGNAGVQTLYDPYRIRKVLKRKPGSKRGENQWQTIDFDKAVTEIVNGGDLFGEGNVEGLKDILAVRDPNVMKALKGDAAKVAKGEMSSKEFQAVHRGNLDKMIDPDFPDLGPKNNQFVFLGGRIEHGRKEFAKRWVNDSMGSANWFEHTTVCEQSHHIAFNESTKQYHEGKWGHGKHHLKPDIPNARFVIFFGTSPFEANFGPTNWVSYITNAQARNGMKMAVVDPRCSHTAGKANYWVPIKCGGDAPLALGMIRWIIDNKRYNESYLQAANRSGGKVNGDTTWTNATQLVVLGEDGKTGTRMLRGSDVGMGSEHEFVVSVNGQLKALDPYKKEDAAVVADLLAEGEVNGLKYKSSFAMLQDIVNEHSVEEWAREAGLDDADLLITLVREFTSYGRQVMADMYRGPVQHTNGYHNGRAIIALNMLVGNADWKGGMHPGGSHWHEDGSKKGQPFPLKKLHPHKLGKFGVKISREGTAYEKTLLFKKNGYPAQRTWYPYTGSVYQEVIPSGVDGYPYHLKALYLHKGTPGLSVPGANSTIDYLRDPKKIPLLFADDIVIGESSMYCDYIFPDTAIWERWGTPHMTPAVLTNGSKVRQPVVESLVENCTVYGRQQPISMESVMLGIAEKLKLSGFGKDGFGPGLDFRTREDYFLKKVANIAYGDHNGKDMAISASDEEMKIFLNARRHMTKAVFEESYWKKAVANNEDLWKRVVTVLNRGGRFEDASGAYKGDHVHHQFKGQFNLFAENVAKGKHSMTGKHFQGMPISEPVLDAAGNRVTFSDAYPFQLFTYKHILGGQSRTISNYWTMVAEAGENYVWMNTIDARKLRLKSGDSIRLVGPSNTEGRTQLTDSRFKDIIGKVKVMEGIRPGTICASWSFGHWAYGSNDVSVDGSVVKGDARRGTGVCPNPVMLVDPAVKNMCLTDPIGGSCSFYDSYVNVERVA